MIHQIVFISNVMISVALGGVVRAFASINCLVVANTVNQHFEQPNSHDQYLLSDGVLTLAELVQLELWR